MIVYVASWMRERADAHLGRNCRCYSSRKTIILNRTIQATLLKLDWPTFQRAVQRLSLREEIMQRLTVSIPPRFNGRLWQPALWRSRTLWLPLLLGGFTIWQATRAESVPQFFTSLLLWTLGLALAYWTIVIWHIVFSIRLN